MKSIQLINIILFFLTFLTGYECFSQSVEDIKYQVISSMIDSTISKLDFDYYYQLQDEPQKIDEDKLEIEKDTMIFINPKTYESDTIANRKAAKKYNIEVIEKRIKEYQKEKKLFESVKELNKKRIFITNFSKKDLRNISDIKRLSDYKELLDELYKSHSFSLDASKIKAKEPFFFESKESSKKLNYKYATVAFITISDVILNKEKTKAVLQIGIHYCINRKRNDGGITGFGGIICLKKNEKGWFSEIGQRLWEE
jgi:hypothetical protein